MSSAIVKLYQLPRGARIRGMLFQPWHPDGPFSIDIIFDRLDGMYSVCHLDTPERQVVHLGRGMEFEVSSEPNLYYVPGAKR